MARLTLECQEIANCLSFQHELSVSNIKRSFEEKFLDITETSIFSQRYLPTILFLQRYFHTYQNIKYIHIYVYIYY